MSVLHYFCSALITVVAAPQDARYGVIAVTVVLCSCNFRTCLRSSFLLPPKFLQYPRSTTSGLAIRLVYASAAVSAGFGKSAIEKARSFRSKSKESNSFCLDIGNKLQMAIDKSSIAGKECDLCKGHSRKCSRQ